MGDIASGWSTQGSVVVSFKVSNDSIVELCKIQIQTIVKTRPCMI